MGNTTLKIITVASILGALVMLLILNKATSENRGLKELNKIYFSAACRNPHDLKAQFYSVDVKKLTGIDVSSKDVQIWIDNQVNQCEISHQHRTAENYSIPDKKASQICAEHITGYYQTGTKHENVKIIDIKGIAFSASEIWCAAVVREKVFVINQKGTEEEDNIKWFSLKEQRMLELNSESKNDFDDALKNRKTINN